MPKDPETTSPDPDDEDEADTTNSKDVDSAESEAESSPDPAPRSKSARSEGRHRERDSDEDDDEAEQRPRRRKKKKKRPKRPLPTTEAEIDAPDMQTLWMLGSLAALVLIMWGGARFACNAHPDETRKPREITTAEISGDPKNTAIEVAQRWATRNFDGALELASGALAAEIQQDKAKCEANPQCTGERSALKDKVLTTGDLLQRLPTSAVVRVTSIGTPDAPRSFVLELTSDGKNWKANVKKAADAPLPTPTGPTGMAPVPLAPTATASVAAAPPEAASAAAPKKAAPKKPAVKLAPAPKPAPAPAAPAP
jgi:hypothetical protein